MEAQTFLKEETAHHMDRDTVSCLTTHDVRFEAKRKDCNVKFIQKRKGTWTASKNLQRQTSEQSLTPNIT